MVQKPLPTHYAELSDEQVSERIRVVRGQLGSRIVILGHHYQRDEIIEHADFRGDSYKLAKDAANCPDREYIVFCGVHFMAESADILTPPSQKVILPNLAAGCSMADMANIFQVRQCWETLTKVIDIERVVPVTYINSAANLKGFVGEHEGTVCTSTNAPTAVKWALERGERMLFFPDQHLGRNTGVRLGYSPEEMIVWNPFRPLGGNTEEEIERARFILWKGHCSVHARFTVEQIEKARREFPDVQVLVHPECTLEVVEASDLNGSTEYIIKTVQAAEPGTTWAIGTEINLVSRLAKENPDKTIFCLDPQICPCSTMYRIHPTFLLWVLEELAEGREMNVVKVPEPTASFARLALERMLTLN
ncbi:MAG: quinolinate synthase NadA [Fimbriimonadaceae bacterium]